MDRSGRAMLGTAPYKVAHGGRRPADPGHQPSGPLHNVRYCRLAEELGSAVDQVDGLEWSGTAMPDTTAAYAAELDGAGQGDGDLSAPRGEPQRP